jgi:hypothetical protein
MMHLPQEISLDDPKSKCTFSPTAKKPFVATRAAIEMYGFGVIIHCLLQLQAKARRHGGLDYLQVFEDSCKPERLWFIEDGKGGAITALLPSDY